MTRIFINYRREDSEDFTGRLYGELEKHFGRDQIFMDIDNIPLGAKFEEYIRKILTQVDVVIVVIGKRWLSIEDNQKQRRLDKADDFVRKEIALAIELKKIVIPVLVKDTKMPEREQLPESIKQLREYNAINIRHEDFRSATKKLIKELENQIGGKRISRKLKMFVAGSVIVLIASVLFLNTNKDIGKEDTGAHTETKNHNIKADSIPEEGNDFKIFEPKEPAVKIYNDSVGVNDIVLAIWHKNNCFYPAKILKAGQDNILVRYESFNEEASLNKNELFLMNKPLEFSRNAKVFIRLDNASHELWVPGIITEIKSSKNPEYRVELIEDTQCNTYWNKNHQYVKKEKLILREPIGR